MHRHEHRERKKESGKRGKGMRLKGHPPASVDWEASEHLSTRARHVWSSVDYGYRRVFLCCPLTHVGRVRNRQGAPAVSP